MAVTEAVKRPVDDREVPEGYELVAAPDPHWRLVSGKRCRMRGTGPACAEPAVAELDRGYAGAGIGSKREHNWWAYCPDHMYGRWAEDGNVMHWILREKGMTCG